MVTRPREGIIQQSGIFEGRQLVLIGRHDRIDWILQGMVALPGEQVLGPPTLGPLQNVLELFHKVVAPWLAVSPQVTRLAFGAVLVKRVDDVASAYHTLSQLLPNVGLAGTDSPDFLYQVNRPRTSQLPIGIRINRLSKWSIIQGGTISIGIGPGATPTVASGSPQASCRLDLDINTLANSSDLIAQDQAQPLFIELVEIGTEIAAKGDIP